MNKHTRSALTAALVVIILLGCAGSMDLDDQIDAAQRECEATEYPNGHPRIPGKFKAIDGVFECVLPRTDF